MSLILNLYFLCFFIFIFNLILKIYYLFEIYYKKISKENMIFFIDFIN